MYVHITNGLYAKAPWDFMINDMIVNYFFLWHVQEFDKFRWHKGINYITLHCKIYNSCVDGLSFIVEIVPCSTEL